MRDASLLLPPTSPPLTAPPAMMPLLPVAVGALAGPARFHSVWAWGFFVGVFVCWGERVGAREEVL